MVTGMNAVSDSVTFTLDFFKEVSDSVTFTFTLVYKLRWWELRLLGVSVAKIEFIVPCKSESDKQYILNTKFKPWSFISEI